MNILIINDNPEMIAPLENDLNGWGYGVISETDAAAALEILGAESFDMVIAGAMGLDMDGAALCQKIKDEGGDGSVHLIYLAQSDSKEELSSVLDAGADDYLVKPINPDELMSRIRIGFRILDLEQQVNIGYQELKKNYFQTIAMFTGLIEIYDEDLGGHCRRVGRLCRELATRHPDISESEYQIVENAGLLHDIGMIGLPGGILKKNRRERDENERKLYLTHPARGQIILDEIEFLQPIGKIVRYHHEQSNGRGFPDGLAGEEIPVLSKVLSGASIYDNLFYRGKRTYDQIVEDIGRMNGLQLDPFVADLLLEMNAESLKEEEKRDYREVAIDELEIGMVLAKDIRMKTGALAMPCDSEVTGYGIEKLKGYERLECIPKNVSVYKYSVRG